MTSSSSESGLRPGEFELIAQLFAPLSRSAPGAFALTDDAAIVAVPAGEELVVTTDALIEGVHFLHRDPPETIAKKSLRVNLSDLAAKGAAPLAYLLALALPDWPDMAWLKLFARGLAQDQKTFGISLIGGDTTRTPGPLTVAITALGTVPRGTMIPRAGAKRGDLVFVTGTIGDAGAGLAILKDSDTSRAPAPGATGKDALIARYRTPTPRAKLGPALRGLASAALDISDGLLADLEHIAQMSKVRLEIEARRIPLSPEFQGLCGDSLETRINAATSGDDYEIAFTAPPSKHDAILEAARRASTTVTEIGRVIKGEGIALLDEKSREIAVTRKGFVHF